MCNNNVYILLVVFTVTFVYTVYEVDFSIHIQYNVASYLNVTYCDNQMLILFRYLVLCHKTLDILESDSEFQKWYALDLNVFFRVHELGPGIFIIGKLKSQIRYCQLNHYKIKNVRLRK